MEQKSPTVPDKEPSVQTKGPSCTNYSSLNVAEYFSNNLTASLIVFFIALPLNLGMAFASGVPVIWALASAVVAAIVLGAISGSPLRICGPADSSMAFVAAIAAKFGLAALGPITLMAGLVQLVAGMLRMGNWFKVLSPSVIHGMLAGTGIFILTGQIHALVDDTPHRNGLLNLTSLPDVVESVMSGNTGHVAALCLGLLSFTICILWERPFVPENSAPNIPRFLLLYLSVPYLPLKTGCQYSI